MLARVARRREDTVHHEPDAAARLRLRVAAAFFAEAERSSGEREAAAFLADAEREDAGRDAEAAPPFLPPSSLETWVSGTPRPLPDLLPPPDFSFTVAQARASASSSGTPRSS